MERRRLGRTGEKVPVIGMGTWRFGVYHNEKERQAEISAIRKGIDLGMNLVDTAEVYSSGRSEEVVGTAVKEDRDRVFIASKVSPENLRKADVIAACERSLKRLGTSYIDIYQVHWPNPEVPIAETMEAMEYLVEQGKVRYIGVSNFSVSQTEEAMEALSKNELASNQVEYSLVNRDAEQELIPYCEKERLTLIAYSPLARGRIDATMIPEDLRVKYGMTAAQIMLNWVTRSESVIAIPKSVNLDHVSENASSVSTRLTDEEYQRLTSD